MIRTAIVEDQQKTSDTIKSFLEKFGEANQQKFEIKQFYDGVDIVNDYGAGFELVFMDIQMAKMNGMDAAKEIRKIDSEVMIIFITNLPQFAVQGYEVDATGFLIKPVKYDIFCQQMDKVMRRVAVKQKEYMALNVNGGMRRVDLSELIYIESDGHYLVFHMMSEDITILSSMKEMEKQLSDKGFFRCNSGYLINLKYVESVDKNTAIVGGVELQISRAKKKKFLESLTEYIGGMR